MSFHLHGDLKGVYSLYSHNVATQTKIESVFMFMLIKAHTRTVILKVHCQSKTIMPHLLTWKRKDQTGLQTYNGVRLYSCASIETSVTVYLSNVISTYQSLHFEVLLVTRIIFSLTTWIDINNHD